MNAPSRTPRTALPPRLSLWRLAHRAPGAGRVFRPRALVAAVLLALGATATAPALAADTPPTQPAGIRASLYGGSGGELFWQRSSDDRGVRGYEITLNGRNLGIRDALSYYDGSLRPNTRYDFSVAAVDTSGQRSPVSRVSLGAAAPVTPVVPATPSAPAVPAAPAPSAPATPVAGAPAAPAGLNVKIYSATSAELFWTRPATPGLRYEISLRGKPVRITDGVSFYQGSLSSSLDYFYDVVAISSDGKRSAPSSIGFGTLGGLSVAPTRVSTTTPSAPAALPAPAGLGASVYSSSSAELFWRRPATPGLRYEVRRDGQLVTTTDGTSHFDKSLSGGRAYTYEVVALDGRGGRSAASMIMLNTQPGAGRPDTPPVTPPTPAAPVTVPAAADGLPATVSRRMKSVFDASNLDAGERVVAVARALKDVQIGPRRGYTVLRYAVDANGTEDTTLGCPEGGKVDVVREGTTRPDFTPSARYVLQGCDTGPLKLDGTLTDRLDGLRGPRDFDVTAERLTIEDQRDGSTVRVPYGYLLGDDGISGGRTAARVGYRGFVGEQALEGVARPYTMVRRADTGLSTIAVSNVAGSDELGLVSEYDLRIGSESATATVRTSRAFTGADDTINPGAGTMTVQGPGYRYVMNADNGDPASFQLDVTENGSTASYTVPWSADLSFDRFVPGNYAPGF